MNYLKDTIGYLSGPIEDVDDLGIGWRQELRAACSSLNLRWLDPTDKPANIVQEIGDVRSVMNKHREMGHWDSLSGIAKRIRRFDLRCCDRANFVVCYIDPDAHMCGTYDELFTMEDQKKPLYVIVKGGKQRCPLWIFAVMDHKNIFDSIDECVQHLILLDKGAYTLDDRWVFLDKAIVC